MIPILFNHDDDNNDKKGNIRAQDLASILAMSMTNSAGVLDIFDNPCEVYQVQANVPTTGYATLTFHKGYLCIYGRLIYVEEGEQVQIQIPSDSSTINGVVGIKIDLGQTGANEVTWFTVTGSWSSTTDNLLEKEIDGVYTFAFYSYTSTSSSVTLNKLSSFEKKLQNIRDFLDGDNFFTPLDTSTNNGQLATTRFVQNVVSAIQSDINYTGFIEGGAYCALTQAGHWYKVLDIAGVRIIYGDIYDCGQNVATMAWWNPQHRISGNKVTICGFSTNYGSNMDEPLHELTGSEVNYFLATERPDLNKPANVDGLCVFNSNGRSNVTGHYICIGAKPQ